MQLVAYGAQDIYLTGNPQITFFKIVYRRHTNFSMESIQQSWNGTVAKGSRTVSTISRNGDLLGRLFIQYTHPPSAGVHNESAYNIGNVSVEIGGQLIDRHYGHWMEVWAELTENITGQVVGSKFQMMSGLGKDKGATLDQPAVVLAPGDVVAHNGSGTQLFNIVNMENRICYMPLYFWFCRNPGLAVPLIALQYHEVKIIVEWNAFSNSAKRDHQLWADYFYLDTDERRRFAQVSHEYLIEQVQFKNYKTDVIHELNFNHPVKELIFTGGHNKSTPYHLTTGPNDTAYLKFNGHDRMAARPLSYYSLTQVWQHHTGCGFFGGSTKAVNGHIGVYSFALKPEEHQPSGTCNFSRIDSAQLILSATSYVNIYAVNYNVLRIMSGMGGLAYSN